VSLDESFELLTLTSNLLAKGASNEASGANVIYHLDFVYSDTLTKERYHLLAEEMCEVLNQNLWLKIASPSDPLPAWHVAYSKDEVISWETYLTGQNCSVLERGDECFAPVYGRGNGQTLNSLLKAWDGIYTASMLPAAPIEEEPVADPKKAITEPNTKNEPPKKKAKRKRASKKTAKKAAKKKTNKTKNK
jgi:hypothetical protein